MASELPHKPPVNRLTDTAFRTSWVFTKRVGAGATEPPHSDHTGHPRPSRFDKSCCDQTLTSASDGDALSNTG